MITITTISKTLITTITKITITKTTTTTTTTKVTISMNTITIIKTQSATHLTLEPFAAEPSFFPAKEMTAIP